MLMDFIEHLNWIDILLTVVCVRAVFIGVKTGFIVEFFKSIGSLFSVFIALHYYSTLTVLAASQLTIFELPTIAILVFLSLWLLTTYAFKLIHEGMLMVFSVQTHPNLDKWGGAFISALRGVVVCAMVFYVLLLTYNPGVIQMAKNSLSRYAVSYLPTGIYAGVYRGFVIKFFPAEKISEEALLVPQLLEDKKARK
jgi:uncharacterized membrane protein required for colicin V production